MGDFESKPNERGNVFHHKLHMDAYLRSYFYSPALYLLSAATARQLVEKHCGPEEPQEVRLRSSYGGQREAGREASSSTTDGQTNTQKVEQCFVFFLCARDFISVALASVQSSHVPPLSSDAAAGRPGVDL